MNKDSEIKTGKGFEKDFGLVFNSDRMRKSTVIRLDKIDEFYSDRSRILYCSSFRRLQQKAQVFSLEPNASVRTRLTHSLEVSDIGRTLANRIGYALVEQKQIKQEQVPELVAVIENACLLHDIGNPPFGHFGESAIRDWAKTEMIECLPEELNTNSQQLKMLLADIVEFDGNPQGIRTVTKLHTDYDKFSLNLTYATLMASLKYPRMAGEDNEGRGYKKAGYFQTEKNLIQAIRKVMGIESYQRFPLVYIMEAADDIAYCMSDIADGIEKGIITEQIFLKAFLNEWKEKYEDENIPKFVSQLQDIKFSRDISVPWSREAINQVVDTFIKHYIDICAGKPIELLTEESEIGKVFEVVKKVSQKLLYTSFEAESIELAGYAVIKGILANYKPLLKLSSEKFSNLVNCKKIDGVEIERRLFNRLGKRYVKAYTFAVKELSKDDSDYGEKEWWLRVHLLIDHISGMTDDFALETYHMLTGIQVFRN